MIAATKLHSEFRRRVNRADSFKNKTFDIPTVDSYLTEAQNIYYDSRLAVLDTDQRVRDDLRSAEEKRYSTTCKTFRDDNRICIAKFPEDIYRRTRQTAIVSCDDERKCADKEITLKIAQTDDLSEILKDTLVQPSFEYETGWADESVDGLYIYHNNAYKVKKIFIDYYKKLPDITTPSLTDEGFYVNAEGVKIEHDQGLILDTTDAYRKVVDIAALLALRDVSDQPNFQSMLNTILQVDKLPNQ